MFSPLSFPTMEEVFDAEIKYIDWCKNIGCKLVNLTKGGGTIVQRTCREETREKMRQSNLGSKNPMYGKIPSQESRDAQSKKMKGRVPSYFSDPEKVRCAVLKTLAKRRNYAGEANPNYANRGPKSKLAKVLLQIDKNGQIINRYIGLKETARNLGYSERTIRKVIMGKLKTYRGYYWKYE